QFSRKFTVPYAPDNALFRTKEGRAKAAEYADQVLQEVEKRALTVVFGKEFAKGKQVIARTSTDANMGWTDLVREEHPDGLKFLLAQARLTQKGIPALMAGNYATYIECLRETAVPMPQKHGYA
ncbi:MAG: hypothetical protein NTY47_04645, partial [Candidatus Omnitrophica bacterium]|nr:hypothetical protein [Candidatus Omnitrophota bacterium]